MTLKDTNDPDEKVFTRVEWMRARGYSDQEIKAYLKRKEQRIRKELKQK